MSSWWRQNELKCRAELVLYGGYIYIGVDDIEDPRIVHSSQPTLVYWTTDVSYSHMNT